MSYTPQERLNIYMQLLPIFELEHPLRTTSKAGFCSALTYIDDFIPHWELKLLLELWEQKPSSCLSHWFPVVMSDVRDNSRCAVLYKAIKKVLPLCKNIKS